MELVQVIKRLGRGHELSNDEKTLLRNAASKHEELRVIIKSFQGNSKSRSGSVDTSDDTSDMTAAEFKDTKKRLAAHTADMIDTVEDKWNDIFEVARGRNESDEEILARFKEFINDLFGGIQEIGGIKDFSSVASLEDIKSYIDQKVKKYIEFKFNGKASETPSDAEPEPSDAEPDAPEADSDKVTDSKGRTFMWLGQMWATKAKDGKFSRIVKGGTNKKITGLWLQQKGVARDSVEVS